MRCSLKGWLVVGLLVGTMVYALAEDITLTTYYPSPRGVYQELRAAGNVHIGGVSDPAARLRVTGDAATNATNLLVLENPNNDAAAVFFDAQNRDWALGASNPGSGAGDQKFVLFDATAGTPRMVIDATGNVGIGTSTPQGSAVLDLSSTTRGLLPPRMSSGQRDLIPPVAGLVIYNTENNRLEVHNGADWVAATVPAGGLDVILDMGCGACGCAPLTQRCELTWVGGVLTDQQCILDLGCTPPPPPPPGY